MNRLINFLTENPSYCKVSRAKVAARLGLSINTVNRFWKSEAFKTIKERYNN